MRLLATLSLAVLSQAAFAAAPSAESASAGAEQVFFSVPPIAPLKLAVPAASKTAEPVSFFEIQDPKPRPAAPAQALGEAVGQVSLPALLDHHRDLLANQQLGASNWNISVAGDPGFKKYFLTFQQSSNLVIRPLGDLNRLRGEGIDVTIAPGLVYHFHVSINIFNPIRGSTLEIHAAQGTRGPDHDIKTGTVLDAVKAKSYIFNADGNEYWVLYGTDVDANTNQLANTRSLLFIHEAGTSTKAWPVAEGSLPVGQPTSVTFGDNSYVLTRSADGQLSINGN
jgi:hypothetical protein